MVATVVKSLGFPTNESPALSRSRRSSDNQQLFVKLLLMSRCIWVYVCVYVSVLIRSPYAVNTNQVPRGEGSK